MLKNKNFTNSPEKVEILLHIFDYDPEPILVLKGNRIFDLNERALNFLSFAAKDEVAGSTLDIFIAEKQPNPELTLSNFKNSLKVLNLKQIYSYRIMLKDRHGKNIFAETVIIPFLVKRNRYYKICIKTSFSGVVSETSADYQVTRYKELFDNLQDGVLHCSIVFDKHNNPVDYLVLEVNKASERIANVSSENLTGKKGSEIFQISPPPYLKMLTETALTGNQKIYETYISLIDKHIKMIISSHSRGYFTTVIQDNTEKQRQIEELNKKNEEIARFTYAVTHDLKSPLVTIRGFIKCLEDDFYNKNYDDIPQDIAFVKNSSNRMWNLLQELLEVAKAGYKKNPYRKVSLRELLSQSVDLVYGSIIKANLCLELPENDLQIYCDNDRMIESFQNIIDNAVKFMGGQEKPHLKITASESDHTVTVNFIDNGIGIKRADQSRIFDIFEKIDSNEEGSGIGLALVKRIIEVHGGKITVESEGPGKGSAFRIVLPKVK